MTPEEIMMSNLTRELEDLLPFIADIRKSMSASTMYSIAKDMRARNEIGEDDFKTMRAKIVKDLGYVLECHDPFAALPPEVLEPKWTLKTIAEFESGE